MNKSGIVQKAIAEIKKGRPVIVIDDPKRENQGDLILPARFITAKWINFMTRECRGQICAAISAERARALELPLMVAPQENREKTQVNFTVSIDAKNVTDFGISASDRAKTIKLLASPKTKPDDFVRPGHVFPLVARANGLRERAGHTEATVELMRLAGFEPVGVLCEILRENGSPARLKDLQKFTKTHKFAIISVADLAAYLFKHPLPRLTKNLSVVAAASAPLPTKYGLWQITIYNSLLDNREQVALAYGNIKRQPTLVRIHSQCLTGDTFGSQRCDCQEQLQASMKMITDHGRGLILYLNQEGRGIGLANKIKAYVLQDKGLDTVEANRAMGFKDDERDYQVAAEILRDLKITDIRLITNNPRKIKGLTGAGLRVVKRIPLEIKPNGINKKYLDAKKRKLGHQLSYGVN